MNAGTKTGKKSALKAAGVLAVAVLCAAAVLCGACNRSSDDDDSIAPERKYDSNIIVHLYVTDEKSSTGISNEIAYTPYKESNEIDLSLGDTYVIIMDLDDVVYENGQRVMPEDAGYSFEYDSKYFTIAEKDTADTTDGYFTLTPLKACESTKLTISYDTEDNPFDTGGFREFTVTITDTDAAA